MSSDRHNGTTPALCSSFMFSCWVHEEKIDIMSLYVWQTRHACLIPDDTVSPSEPDLCSGVKAQACFCVKNFKVNKGLKYWAIILDHSCWYYPWSQLALIHLNFRLNTRKILRTQKDTALTTARHHSLKMCLRFPSIPVMWVWHLCDCPKHERIFYI